MAPKDLTGQVAIVTGAAQGMGQATAQALARAGVQVVAVDLNQEKVQQITDSIGGLGLVVDVTDEAAVGALVEQTMAAYGRIDILVNNAGIMRPTRIFGISKAEWDLVLDVNLNGVFLCTSAVLGIMKDQGYGRIVNMSSSAGRSVSTLGGAHYTAAKAAVLGFTRAVAKEVAPLGITVNAVCPGLIDTPMARTECSPERLQAYADSFPARRLGTPEEVADLIVFLVSGAPYVTGASIDINGGDLMM